MGKAPAYFALLLSQAQISSAQLPPAIFEGFKATEGDKTDGKQNVRADPAFFQALVGSTGGGGGVTPTPTQFTNAIVPDGEVSQTSGISGSFTWPKQGVIFTASASAPATHVWTVTQQPSGSGIFPQGLNTTGQSVEYGAVNKDGTYKVKLDSTRISDGATASSTYTLVVTDWDIHNAPVATFSGNGIGQQPSPVLNFGTGDNTAITVVIGDGQGDITYNWGLVGSNTTEGANVTQWFIDLSGGRNNTSATCYFAGMFPNGTYVAKVSGFKNGTPYSFNVTITSNFPTT